jgi:hypothetical protein
MIAPLFIVCAALVGRRQNASYVTKSFCNRPSDANEATGLRAWWRCTRDLRLTHSVGELEAINGGPAAETALVPPGSSFSNRRGASSECLIRSPFFPCSTAGSATTLCSRGTVVESNVSLRLGCSANKHRNRQRESSRNVFLNLNHACRREIDLIWASLVSSVRTARCWSRWS